MELAAFLNIELNGGLPHNMKKETTLGTPLIEACKKVEGVLDTPKLSLSTLRGRKMPASFPPLSSPPSDPSKI